MWLTRSKAFERSAAATTVRSGGFSLIKAVRDFGGEGKKGGNRGAGGAEAMLRRGLRKRGKKERTNKTFKDFGGRTE